MATQVNLNDAQFRAFTQFAASVSDKGTVLKANDNPLTASDGTPRKIVAKGYDGYGHIWRKQPSKDINNDVRTLFRDTVLRMFGVNDVQNLPDDVKTAMKTGDYDKGKPLTARRIIAVSTAIAKVVDPVNKSVSMQKAEGLVDDSLKFINGKGKNPKVRDAVLTDEQRTKAASLVSSLGRGMTDTCLKIFTNYVVLAIANGSFKGNAVDVIAHRMAEELKNVRNFKPGDVRFAKFDAKLTEYWQSMLEEQMGDAKLKMYDGEGLFESFKLDAFRASFTIAGEKFNLDDQRSDEMIDKFKETIPNIQHRKAISTFMSQLSGNVYVAFTNGANPLPTPKFKNLDMTSEKGYDMLLTPDMTDPLFEGSLLKLAEGLEYTLKVEENGRKAKITAHYSGDLKFGIENSGDCSANATGTYTYETEFEFDLSDENEAKLTGTHFSQMLGMPKSDEQAEPPVGHDLQL